jgi:hypothetical protein
MTTFTTEDRLIAEKNGSVTINVEPIPFAGLVTITETPKYKDLTDEEIEAVWIQALQDEPKANAGKFPSLANQPFVFFARAILKKAQEK